jgi:hypothetical protein
MVAHQAISPDAETILSPVPAQQIEIETAVCVREERNLPAVSSLSDVVRKTGYNHARDPRHALE